jgi:hypothetical protein
MFVTVFGVQSNPNYFHYSINCIMIVVLQTGGHNEQQNLFQEIDASPTGKWILT